MNLLFPGRHHILTNFQLSELSKIISGKGIKDINGNQFNETVDTVIWAVTSANHSYTRRNPLPSSRREAMIEKFSENIPATSLVYHIDDIAPTPKFAEYVIKKIRVDSDGKLSMNPKNTVVGCSTPVVIKMYQKLGFKIFPFELIDLNSKKYKELVPWNILDMIVRAGKSKWRDDKTFLTKTSKASIDIYLKYNIGDSIVELHTDPLFATNDGDITATRDYNTYVRAFDEGAERKYDLIRNYVNPGKIVDIGCCTGSLIRQLSFDPRLSESDFYGIEVARTLFEKCVHRKQEEHYFGNDNVFFYQRNIASGKIFPDYFVDTFTTFSLTHEIESYQGRDALKKFISFLHQQLDFSGRWINVDVVGPKNKNEIVYLNLNTNDGRNTDYSKVFGAKDRSKFKSYLDSLSTFAKFLRFAQDFRKLEGYKLKYSIEHIDGKEYIKLKSSDASEFLSKKDYTDNWNSEMHETFCFFNFDEWIAEVKKAGFIVNPASHAFSNPWIIENRYKNRAILYHKKGRKLVQAEYPETNMILVLDKVENYNSKLV